MKKIAYFSLALALTACGGKTQMPEQSNDFTVETVRTAEADVNTSYPATIRGIQDIEIRPKIAGHITKVLVDEGDFVRAGQPMFLIDRVQYEAAVKSAEANIKVMQSNISTQELTVENKRKLYEKQIISKYDYDIAQNQLQAFKAQLAQSRAALTDAKNNLSYCTITSPSNGVVGTIPFRVGSLVSSASAEPLTTVSNISKVYVYFSMTEKQLLDLTRESGGIEKAIEAMPAINLVLADGSQYSQQGHITAVSGVIDQNTGAVQMRATFDNAGLILRSGGTGSILIPTHSDNAILIPQKATYDIQNKKFVYIVNQNNTVDSREIQVMTQNDGKSYIVTSGLKAGERIVTEGVNQLKKGMKINPITPQQAEKNRAKANQDLKDGKMPGEK
ncbi:multidrug resistance protein MdtE [Bacteroidaceae bacterium]|uniref:efflux RND transporter periplasmic adaptor subunit n=1 Tax=Prevotella sp. MGM2 TaxID=2033406 RepID=UPI000CE9F375|nr:efflux RND transporter periplasmic adaptor subunit [Prevotella sp. MGM2]GFI33897.1 multidrug resistance protein MdtE [Bacteroidaceae bacterium]